MANLEQLAIHASAVRQKLWRSAGPAYNLAIREGVRRIFPPARSRPFASVDSLRVVGLLSTATGIGQSARLCLSDLKSTGHTAETRNLSPLFRVDHGISFEQGVDSASRPGGVTIYHLNPPLMLLGMMASGIRRYYASTNIAVWAWELPELPPEWIVALRYVDAVVTPSTFCRDIIARHTDKPVVVVPHPVPITPETRNAKRTLASEQPFRVLTIFNCGSSLYRKNPVATIDAFKRAFGNDMRAELILKISDGRQHQSDIAFLETCIRDAPNIRIVDEMMEKSALDSLIRTADAYVSLHRSEGFGLTVAEAIMSEIPVVVTDWSGTADFCPSNLAYTVDYEMVPVNDPHPAYCHVRDARWAEPSIETAARRLIEIRNDPHAARARSHALRRSLIARLKSNRYYETIKSLCENK
jgi:glycosyltransferase involved in cell wall biosynthesis